MKLITSISMSFLFLTQGMNINMNLCEKMEDFSNFISHYKVHKEYGGDSFYEYVVEELFSSDGDNKAHHNGSHEDHSPAHSHNQCYHPSVFITSSYGVTLKALATKTSNQYTYYSFKFNSRYLESLFQPPRV
jgi:hypothetical protein